MLEAIAEKTERDEQRQAMDDVAEQRWTRLAASGKAVPWSEMRRWFEERAAGAAKAARPAARKLTR